MSEQKMIAYIQKTPIRNAIRYEIYIPEIRTLYQMASGGRIYEAFGLAFEYGRAKGYRMAKNEVKNGKSK